QLSQDALDQVLELDPSGSSPPLPNSASARQRVPSNGQEIPDWTGDIAGSSTTLQVLGSPGQ
ncbi:hypothetical protein Cpir12675_005860, partial [Ceratocystis pirilliformis]